MTFKSSVVVKQPIPKISWIIITLLLLCIGNVFAVPVWTDLSATDTGNWMDTTTVNSIASSTDGNVYTGGAVGKFGRYSPTTNVWTDLSTTDAGNWMGNDTINIVAISSDNNVYVGLGNGSFGRYSPTTNVLTNLSTTDPANWVGTTIFNGIASSSDGNIYTILDSGKFGRYSPTTNVWTDLSTTDAGDWVGTTTGTKVVMGTDGNVYTSLASGKFGRYSPTTNVWTDLSTTDPANWVGTDYVYSVASSTDGNIYTSLLNGKFGRYSPTTNVWTDLSATDTGNWVVTAQNRSIAIDSENNVYTGLSNGKFGRYSPTTNVWTDLSTTDAGDWVGTTNSVNSVSNNNDIIYTGLTSGKFGSFSANIFVEPTKIDWNVYLNGTTTHLTGVSADCNVNLMDFTNQTSPITGNDVEKNTSYSCVFSRTGYDSNTQTGIVDSNKTVTVYLTDSTKPVTTISGNTYATWTTTNQTITLTCTDSGSGCNGTIYNLDSTGWTTYSAPFVISTDGNHTIDYNSIDVAGNVEVTKRSYAAIDKTAPTTTFSGTGNDWNKSTISINLSCADSNSGCANTYYRINSAGAYSTYSGAFGVSDGNNKIDYYSTDNAGNSETPKTNYAAQDRVNPTTSGAITAGTVGSNGWYTSNVTYTITPADATSGVKFTYYCTDTTNACTPTTAYTVPITVSTESATNYVRFYSGDNADNNQSVQSSGIIKIDKTAPTIATPTINGFSTSTTYINGTGNIYATRSDALSGIANCYYRINDTSAWILTNTDSNTTHCIKTGITITNGTTYKFAMQATDNAGNSKDGDPYATTFIGSTQPTTTTSVTITDINQYARRFTITCTDATVGCKTGQTYYQINEGTILSGNSPIDHNQTFATGMHSIKYWSTNNLDINEVSSTTYFYITGRITIRVKDENSGLDLNGVTFTLNGTPVTIDTTSIIDLNVLATTTTNYIAAFTKTGYGTRYYQFDGNRFSTFDINFLMLPTILGSNLSYLLYDSTGTTLLPNTYFQMNRVDRNNWIIGRTKTSATATTTLFTNVFDQNYTQLIADTNTYSMVALSVLYPKNQETGVQITQTFEIDLLQNLYESYSDLNTTQIVYLLPNTELSYLIKIVDTNLAYYPKTYSRGYKGNPLTDSLQPYLILTASAYLTTIYTLDASNNNPISNVTLDIYSPTSGGYVLVDSLTTDASGSAQIALISLTDYYFDVYKGTTTWYTKERKQAITNVIYFYLVQTETDWNYDEPVFVTNYFSPGYYFLSTLTTDRIVRVKTSCNETSTTDYNMNVYQQGIHIYNFHTTANQCEETNVFTIGTDFNVPDYNYPITFKLTVIYGDSNTGYWSKDYLVASPFGGIDIFKILRYDLKQQMGCSTDNNPLLPCVPLLVFFVIFLIVTSAGVSKVVGFSVKKIGMLSLFELIFFTSIGFVPVGLAVLMGIVVLLTTFVVATGSDF